MLHRKPTRIELKLEDMEEYEVLRKEQLDSKPQDATPSTVVNMDDSIDDKQKMVRERIGYNPQPRPSRIPRPIH